MRRSLELNIVFLLGIAAIVALIAYLHRMERQLVQQNAQITQQNQRLLALETEQSKRLSWKGKIKTGLALTWQATKEYILRQHMPTV